MDLGTGQLATAAWRSIWATTALAVVASALFCLVVVQCVLAAFGMSLRGPGLALSLILPVVLCGPMMFFNMVRLQQVRLANERLQILASTDWLTACLNRRAFTHRVNWHLKTLQRSQPGGESALLVIDADHFKMINDQYGHDRGDEVLRLMAAVIRANVREDDEVGRIGGEEFAVLLKGANLECARNVAERIRRAISAASFSPEGQELRLSVSVGGAYFDRPTSFADLFRTADRLLYGAKQLGRNRVEIAEIEPAPLAAAA